MRLAKYIAAWAVINISLSMLWVVLAVPAQWAFLLGVVHGGLSQIGLTALFVMRLEE